MPDEYNVYEQRNSDKKWIGSVNAESLDDAREDAHDQYGSPITVEKNE